MRSGTLNWRWEAPEEIRWTFRAGDGYVGVSTVTAEVALIDMLSGEVKLTLQLPAETYGDVEGVIRDDALVLMPVVRTGGTANPALISINLTDGAVRWRHEPFGATGAPRAALWKLLRLADDVIPMLVTDDDATFGRIGRYGVELIDKATGARIGPKVPTGRTLTREDRPTGEVVLSARRLLIGTRRGVLALPIAATPTAGGSDGVR